MFYLFHAVGVLPGNLEKRERERESGSAGYVRLTESVTNDMKNNKTAHHHQVRRME